MRRLTATTVRSALVTAWRRASAPTRRFPFLATATTDGVSRYPLRLGITAGTPPWTVATTELVVPRSMPMTGSGTLLHESASERLEEGFCFGVVGLILQHEQQLRSSLGRLLQADEGAGGEDAQAVLAGEALEPARGPAPGAREVAERQGAAGCTGRRVRARRFELDGGGVARQRLAEVAGGLALLAQVKGGGRARLDRLALDFGQLGRDLLAAGVELARRAQHLDGDRPLSVGHVLERLFVQLPRRAHAREALGAKEALAPLMLPSLLLLPSLRAQAGGGAVSFGERGRVVAVVFGAGLVVGEDLVGRGHALEGAREHGAEIAQLLAVPGVGVEPLAALEVGPADGAPVGVRTDAEKLVMGDPNGARFEGEKLVLDVEWKIDDHPLPCCASHSFAFPGLPERESGFRGPPSCEDTRRAGQFKSGRAIGGGSVSN